MTTTPNTPAAAPLNDKPLPVLAGKRSNGKADRSGDPRADRAVRAARAAKTVTTKAATPAKEAAAPAKKGHVDAARDAALAKAAAAKTLAAAAKALTEAAHLRTVRGLTEAAATAEPTNAPLRATGHPVATEGTLRCYGACGYTLPVARFQYVGPKATATARYTECTPCQVDRLEVNKARKAAGLDTIARPRVAAADLPS